MDLEDSLGCSIKIDLAGFGTNFRVYGSRDNAMEADESWNLCTNGSFRGVVSVTLGLKD
jgi:hypothetical protein